MSTAPRDGEHRPRAFAYVRMSTKEQEEGDSRRRQLELARIYAADKSLELVTAFEGEPFEDVGLSAFTGEHLTRGKLGRFFQALREGRTIRNGDYLLVESLDRVSRQAPMIAFRIFSEIIEGGVTLVTTADRHEYKSDLDLGGMIQSIVVMGRSNEESELKKDRLTKVWIGKRQDTAAKKLTSLRPAWLDIAEWDHSGKTPLPKAFKPIPQRVAIVHRIFEESASGIGNRTIAERLFRDGIAPFGLSGRTKKDARHKHRWQSSSVEKILRNRSVLGEFQAYRVVSKKPLRREPVGDPIPKYYGEPIIPQALFDRAQAAREQRKTWSDKRGGTVGKGGNRGKYISNLFSGLLSCAYCDSKMHFLDKGKLPKGGKYLICANARSCERDGPITWRYDHFEATFLAWVHRLDLESIMRNEDDAAKRRALEETIQAAEGQKAELAQQRDNFITSIARTTNPAVIDAVNSALEKCLSRLSELNSEIEAKRTQLASLVSEAAAFYESKDEIKSLIEPLRNREDPKTYLLRAQIAARLKALVSEIRVATAGPVAGKDFIETFPAIDLPKGRYFSVRFKDGSIADYIPDADTDDVQIVETD